MLLAEDVISEAERQRVANNVVRESFLRKARGRRFRTMRQFVEQEIVIPDGPFAKQRLRMDIVPHFGLWVDEVDSGRWREHWMTGGAQGGKSLWGYVIPTVYHIFELEEGIIAALPDAHMISDKWNDDLLPIIRAMPRYAGLLPKSGRGSRGGVGTSITFGNGAELRWMTGGANDKGRAGKTRRVLAITETDGMDAVSGKGTEADKVAQLKARTNSYGDRARIYAESTLTTTTGRTWNEYQNGTASKIATPCPECEAYVFFDREHLIGWEEAESEHQAEDEARWICPECGSLLNDEQRRESNRHCVLVHRGQSVNSKGEVEGDLPQTHTLGYRFNAFHNTLMPTARIAGREWAAARDAAQDKAERDLKLHWWALPLEPLDVDDTDLSWRDIIRRVGPWAKGQIPPETECVTYGVDLGRWQIHYWVLGMRCGYRPHTMEYGVLEVPTLQLGEEKAITGVLDELVDRLEGEYPDPWGAIDAGNHKDLVQAFCRERNKGIGWRRHSVRPIFGRGGSVYHGAKYDAPKKRSVERPLIGPSWHVDLERSSRSHRLVADVDTWKMRVHDALSIQPEDQGQPIHEVDGALTLHQVDKPGDHGLAAKHLTAEHRKTVFEPGKGERQAWDVRDRQNHLFDGCVYSFVMASVRGFNPHDDSAGPQPPRSKTTSTNRRRRSPSEWMADRRRRAA